MASVTCSQLHFCNSESKLTEEIRELQRLMKVASVLTGEYDGYNTILLLQHFAC